MTFLKTRKSFQKILSIILTVFILTAAVIIPANAKSKALSKSDFGFGGRSVNGYTNFVDLCEKQGGKHEYYFDTPSSACRKANRGINVDQIFCYDEPNYNPNATFKNNKIFDEYGKMKKIDCGKKAPSFVIKKNDGYNWINWKYDYEFKNGGRTFHKIFYFYTTAPAGEYIVSAIEYTVS